jgi:isocitrate/isopropylmalate dehydrogenase
MDLYPAALLPHQTYPAAIPETEVLDHCFVREITEDIYSFLDSEFAPDDVIKNIVMPAICPKIAVKKFQRADFDSIMKE